MDRWALKPGRLESHRDRENGPPCPVHYGHGRKTWTHTVYLLAPVRLTGTRQKCWAWSVGSESHQEVSRASLVERHRIVIVNRAVMPYVSADWVRTWKA